MCVDCDHHMATTLSEMHAHINCIQQFYHSKVTCQTDTEQLRRKSNRALVCLLKAYIRPQHANGTWTGMDAIKHVLLKMIQDLTELRKFCYFIVRNIDARRVWEIAYVSLQRADKIHNADRSLNAKQGETCSFFENVLHDDDLVTTIVGRNYDEEHELNAKTTKHIKMVICMRRECERVDQIRDGSLSIVDRRRSMVYKGVCNKEIARMHDLQKDKLHLKLNDVISLMRTCKAAYNSKALRELVPHLRLFTSTDIPYIGFETTTTSVHSQPTSQARQTQLQRVDLHEKVDPQYWPCKEGNANSKKLPIVSLTRSFVLSSGIVMNMTGPPMLHLHKYRQDQQPMHRATTSNKDITMQLSLIYTQGGTVSADCVSLELKCRRSMETTKETPCIEGKFQLQSGYNTFRIKLRAGSMYKDKTNALLLRAGVRVRIAPVVGSGHEKVRTLCAESSPFTLTKAFIPRRGAVVSSANNKLSKWERGVLNRAPLAHRIMYETTKRTREVTSIDMRALERPEKKRSC